MSTNVVEPSPKKKHGHTSRVVGRSAVTGKIVLRPVSKRGSIPVEQVRKAVKSVSDKSKKP